nr:MAG TPA_asm: hypothetical protein [Caudoviricetes sp.]
MKNHFNYLEGQTSRLNYLEGKISAYRNILTEFKHEQPNMIRKNLEFYIQELTKDQDQLLQTHKQKQIKKLKTIKRILYLISVIISLIFIILALTN